MKGRKKEGRRGGEGVGDKKKDRNVNKRMNAYKKESQDWKKERKTEIEKERKKEGKKDRNIERKEGEGKKEMFGNRSVHTYDLSWLMHICEGLPKDIHHKTENEFLF